MQHTGGPPSLLLQFYVTIHDYWERKKKRAVAVQVPDAGTTRRGGARSRPGKGTRAAVHQRRAAACSCATGSAGGTTIAGRFAGRRQEGVFGRRQRTITRAFRRAKAGAWSAAICRTGTGRCRARSRPRTRSDPCKAQRTRIRAAKSSGWGRLSGEIGPPGVTYLLLLSAADCTLTESPKMASLGGRGEIEASALTRMIPANARQPSPNGRAPRA